jgi:hypothetical membrane protein
MKTTTEKSDALTSTRTLLACGIVAAILFPLVVGIQVLTREGFDINRHPLSLLSLGDIGWIQISNFILSGALFLAFSVGLRRRLRGGAGKTWGPLLIGIYGVFLVAAGIFTVDPMDGFPPGTPAGLPATLSWHAQLHNMTFFVVFLSLLAAQFVFARRFAKAGQWGWAVYSLISALATPSMIALAYATPPLFGVILFSMGLLGDLWFVLIAVRTLTENNQSRAGTI